MIKNDAILNEELDPKLMIQKLKRENQQLKDQITMINGDQSTLDLNDEEISKCEVLVTQYLQDNNPESSLDIGADMRKVHECFRIMKVCYNHYLNLQFLKLNTIEEKI